MWYSGVTYKKKENSAIQSVEYVYFEKINVNI